MPAYKRKTTDELKELSKEELINLYNEIYDSKEYYQSEYEELDDQVRELEDEIEELEKVIPADDKTMILDLELFTEKLSLYGLDNETLLNFIDLYMRLYN